MLWLFLCLHQSNGSFSQYFLIFLLLIFSSNYFHPSVIVCHHCVEVKLNNYESTCRVSLCSVFVVLTELSPARCLLPGQVNLPGSVGGRLMEVVEVDVVEVFGPLEGELIVMLEISLLSASVP